ncbi:hypothetical protein [Roseomonas chloroacetimidivorans]|uniref:hypothetical protein n=1 Tax=Roseomonas chloroacetimidivorans TaxID=1766656 RepID=UPI003C73C920
MTPIREKVPATLAERLAEQIPGIPVERARRAAPADEDFPRLIVRAGDVTPNDGTSFGETTYTVTVIVTGYTGAEPDAEDQDLSCEQALSDLHARVVAALAAWQPDGVDLNEVREAGTAEFLVYDIEDSARALGEFTASFEVESVRPTGHPYAVS